MTDLKEFIQYVICMIHIMYVWLKQHTNQLGLQFINKVSTNRPHTYQVSCHLVSLRLSWTQVTPGQVHRRSISLQLRARPPCHAKLTQISSTLFCPWDSSSYPAHGPKSKANNIFRMFLYNLETINPSILGHMIYEYKYECLHLQRMIPIISECLVDQWSMVNW